MSQIAFITGAASGIGQATAKKLFEQGWTIGLADINIHALDELQNTITDSYSGHNSDTRERLHIFPLDVTDPSSYDLILKEFMHIVGHRLNLLFNCAGVLKIDRFEELAADEHQRILDINIMGTINGCQAAFPYLKLTPRSQVINMSSASATYGIPKFATYSASKFAIRGLTEALNIEWSEYGIHVGDIMPPFVNTPMVSSQSEESPIMKTLGVNLKPEDVALAVIEQIDNRKVHRTVSVMFSILYSLNEISPSAVTRYLIKKLNRATA